MMPATALLVGDDTLIALGLQERLAPLGYTVVGIVRTGEEAIAQAGHQRPDLVLMDMHLAGAMDGISAAQTIWERYALPVIFLTAYNDARTLEPAPCAASAME